jgi:hypothetical protein
MSGIYGNGGTGGITAGSSLIGMWVRPGMKKLAVTDRCAAAAPSDASIPE